MSTTESPVYRVEFSEASRSVVIKLDGALIASVGEVGDTAAADAVLAQLGWRRCGRWRSHDAREWAGSAVQV